MLEISNLKKSYQQPVLVDINLSVKKGEFVGILGENGCGKSTLIEIIAGALEADGGEILINGISAFQNKKIFSQYIGYVPQENPLIEELTVKDNLKLWYCFGNRNLKEDFEQGPPAMLGLKEVQTKRAGNLSGGMKKRLSIACALACNAPILLLDEPSAALDMICKADIHQYLNYYIKNGGTVIMTSHEESEISLCSRLYIMKKGCLQEVSNTLRGEELILAIKN